jgi:hypothetical protein
MLSHDIRARGADLRILDERRDAYPECARETTGEADQVSNWPSTTTVTTVRLRAM